jgi:outer membrane lipoprotein-sorting protein
MKSRLLIFFLLALLPGALSAQKWVDVKDPEALTKQIREATQKINTIECSFSQEKNMSVIAEKILSKGKFYLKKPGKLRWEYTDPFNYLIIISNNQLFVKDENSENKINLETSKVFREINNIIIGAVQGTLLNDKTNFNTRLFEIPGAYIARLEPKNARIKESLKEIRLFINRQDLSVDKLEMVESSGDFTSISFQAKKFNTPIADEKFVVK